LENHNLYATFGKYGHHQARTPATKSSIAVLSPRFCCKQKSRRWLREWVAAGF